MMKTKLTDQQGGRGVMKIRLTDQHGGGGVMKTRLTDQQGSGGGVMKIRLTDQRGGVGGSDEDKADRPAGAGRRQGRYGDADRGRRRKNG